MNNKRVQIIEDKLTHALNPEQLNITDDSQQHIGHAGAKEGHGHFTVNIVAAAFEGKGLIERHRMVYDALSDLMKTDIHALCIQAKTPSEP